MQERICSRELARAVKRMTIPVRLSLLDEVDLVIGILKRADVCVFVPGGDDDADFMHPSAQNLLKDDSDRRLLGSVRVNEHLERKAILVPARRCDDSFFDVHRFVFGRQSATGFFAESIRAPPLFFGFENGLRKTVQESPATEAGNCPMENLVRRANLKA